MERLYKRKHMKNYELQTKPFIVATNDGKLIEEHFGKTSIEIGDYSFAHMIAPSGWSEPFQTPEFDEITYIISGKKKFEVDGEEIILEKNQSICVKKEAVDDTPIPLLNHASMYRFVSRHLQLRE